jgi:hypothetical protein
MCSPKHIHLDGFVILKPPLGPWGWFNHPQRLKKIKKKKKEKKLALEGGQTTPKGQGVASTTLDRLVWGGRSHPLLSTGVASHPFLFNINILLFLLLF